MPNPEHPHHEGAHATSPGTVVASFYLALAGGYLARAAELLADDVTWRVPDTPAGAGVHRGRTAVSAYLATFDPWEALDLHPERFVSSDCHVIVAGYYRARAASPDRSAQVAFVHVCAVEDGQIVAIDEVADRNGALRMSGEDAFRQSNAYAAMGGG